MRLRAVTFDFWSTLVDGNITPERTAQRLSRLHAAIVGAGHAFTPEELRSGFHGFDRHVDERHRLGQWLEGDVLVGVLDHLVGN